MNDITAGFAVCGSFCTFSKVLVEMKVLKDSGINLLPIMSETAYSTDTRFGKSEDINSEIKEICGRDIIHTITQAEPIGPQKLLDILIIAPCTGNTIAKLANSITDTTVTMAAKSHLRNSRPVLIGIATNDALGASATNIGKLMNCKNVYFIPMRQDNSEKKPKSVVADFSRMHEALEAALEHRQLQPLLI